MSLIFSVGKTPTVPIAGGGRAEFRPGVERNRTAATVACKAGDCFGAIARAARYGPLGASRVLMAMVVMVLVAVALREEVRRSRRALQERVSG